MPTFRRGQGVTLGFANGQKPASVDLGCNFKPGNFPLSAFSLNLIFNCPDQERSNEELIADNLAGRDHDTERGSFDLEAKTPWNCQTDKVVILSKCASAYLNIFVNVRKKTRMARERDRLVHTFSW